MDHDLALGGEAADEQRVEAPESVPVEVPEVVARRVRAVRLDLDAGRLRTAGKPSLAETLADPAADAQHEAAERCDGHGRARRAEASTRVTIWSASTPAAPAAKLRTSR